MPKVVSLLTALSALVPLGLGLKNEPSFLIAMFEEGILILQESTDLHPAFKAVENSITTAKAISAHGHDKIYGMSNVISRAENIKQNLRILMITRDDNGIDPTPVTPRYKRAGWWFLGSTIHEITGVPSPYQFKHQVAVTKAIKEKLHSLLLMTSNLSKNVDMIREISSINSNQIKAIYNATSQLLTKTNNIIKNTADTDFALKSFFKLNQHLDQVDSVVHNAEICTLTALTEHLMAHGISEENLAAHIADASKVKNGATPLFDPSEAHMYFKFKNTRIVRHNSHIVTFVHVPLVNHNREFLVHHLHLNGTRKIGDSFLLIRKETHEYRVLADKDVKRAIHASGTLVLDLRPAYSKFNTFTCNQHRCMVNNGHLVSIIEIDHETFTYDTYASENFTVSYSCEGMKNVKSWILRPADTIKIPAHCSIDSTCLSIRQVRQEHLQYYTPHKVKLLRELPLDPPAHKKIAQLELDFAKGDALQKQAKEDTQNIQASLNATAEDLQNLQVDYESTSYLTWAIGGTLTIILMIFLTYCLFKCVKFFSCFGSFL